MLCIKQKKVQRLFSEIPEEFIIKKNKKSKKNSLSLSLSFYEG